MHNQIIKSGKFQKKNVEETNYLCDLFSNSNTYILALSFTLNMAGARMCLIAFVFIKNDAVSKFTFCFASPAPILLFHIRESHAFHCGRRTEPRARFPHNRALTHSQSPDIRQTHQGEQTDEPANAF